MKTAMQAARGPYLKTATSSSTIKRLRIAQGMTQVQCAAHCRVPLRTFQRAEADDYVERSTKRSIERALGLSW
ncbi:hypothetical protein RD110_10300 [Rhodoferax koreense]|uniref:HTH cro/C1-type domain-containing protein n=1 Tax=Rhodoferax koreensis TaxID=1842727 RepID=A0A1P8JUT2_9BURK|nr:hypothetical protein RD110_10300 [Rhodoferax koreense]